MNDLQFYLLLPYKDDGRAILTGFVQWKPVCIYCTRGIKEFLIKDSDLLVQPCRPSSQAKLFKSTLFLTYQAKLTKSTLFLTFQATLTKSTLFLTKWT